MDLEKLFEEGGIDLERGEIFKQTPGAMPEGFVFEERVEGMMLGLAIGDALGRPTEGRKPEERRKKHGEVRTYVIGRRAKQACHERTEKELQTAQNTGKNTTSTQRGRSHPM